MYVVARSAIRLRSGPGLGYSTLATLAIGTVVEYLAAGGRADGYEWAKVRVASLGRTGFVAFQYLASIPSDGLQIGMMVHVKTAGGGNLRSGPGTGYAVLRVVAQGTTGTIVDGPVEANGYFWFKISFGNAVGWMATAVLGPGAGADRTWVQVIRGPVNVRQQPGLSGAIVASMPVGAMGFITTATPQEANGYVWVNVQFNQGARGWVAKSFLAVV
jgi:uncharacterized protein YraI